MAGADRSPASRASLTADLAALGVRPGDLLMVHAGLRSLGPITGGVNTVVQALQDAIGPTGTLAAYVDFEPFYDEDEEADESAVPIFDKRIAHAARDHGILHETLRNWPGAIRSDHPDAGVVAIGPRAGWITADHPFQYGYGEGSPFEKIVQADGRVLMLGAPLDTITLLHYAEHRARLPGKRIRRYRRRMPPHGDWVWFEEFDTSEPVLSAFPENSFELIATDFLRSGQGRAGRVGASEACYLLDGPALVQFGIEWMEQQRYLGAR